MIELANRVSQGGTALEEVAQISGQTAESFRKNFKEDAASAILSFIEGLGNLQRSGQDIFPILDQLGLDNIRVRDALLRTAGAGDLVRRSLDLASDAYAANTALTEEARKRYETFASQSQILFNRLKDIAITIGNAVIPTVTELIQTISPVVSRVAELSSVFAAWFQSLNSGVRQGIVILIAGLAALGPILLATGLAASALASAIAAAGSALSVIGGILGAISLPVLGFLAAFVAVAAGIVTAVAVIVANWQEFKAFSDRIWTGIVDFIQSQIVDRFQRLVEAMKAILSPVLRFFGMVTENIGKALSPVKSILSDTADDAKEGLQIIKASIFGEFEGMLGTLNQIGPAIGKSFQVGADQAEKEVERIASFTPPLTNEAIELQNTLTRELLNESGRRLAIIDQELKERVVSIKAMKITTEQQEELITQATSAASKKRAALARDNMITVRNLETEITASLVSEKQHRMMVIQNELQDRVKAIKGLGLAVAEEERLITLAMQSAAVERQRIQGGFNAFMIKQLEDLAASNVFTLSTITQGFSKATADWIQGVDNFAQFWQQTLNTMLTAAINFVIQWLAQLTLAQVRQNVVNTGILASHTATEEAKTAVTTANEGARTVIAAATNKVIMAGVIATLAGIAAVGNAAMAVMGTVVATTAATLTAIGVALAASIVGAPMAPAFFNAAFLVAKIGSAAVIAGLGAIQAAVGTAIGTATAALATPLAEGGLVTQPTFALIGEAGPEAVIPMSRLGNMMSHQVIEVPVNLNGREIARVIVEDEMPSMFRRQGIKP